MSAVMPATGPGQAAAAPPRAQDPGFFAHHGVWAPGVRLFRSMRFTAKAVVISLAFMVPMLGLVSWLLKTQADQALASRMDATQQQVQMAHRLLVWAQGQERAGSLTRDHAQRFARQAVAALGQNIWLRSRGGDDLPQAETALSAPHVQGQGFVTHSPPAGGTSAAQVFYVQDFEPWAWAVGAAVPMADLRAGLAQQLWWAGGIVMLAQLIAGYLFLRATLIKF